jgi:hypothetical protein
MPENRPHPRESSTARGNQHTVAVDLRSGRSHEMTDQSSLRDAVLAAQAGQKKSGVRVLSGRR